jgi:hypothetical protein
VHPLYWDARFMHHNREAVFGHDRSRSSTNGKDPSSRLNAGGIPAQRLRGWAAVTISWFQIALRHGFLEQRTMTVKHNTYRAQRCSTVIDPRTGAIIESGVGIEDYLRRIDERRQNDTDLPFSTVWEQNL